MQAASHKPVMIDEAIASLMPKTGEIYVDGTFGAGGYSKAILESSDCKVIAIDRDEMVTRYAEVLKKKYSDRFVFVVGEFANMKSLLKDIGIREVDGVVLDIGVSSMQLDTKERGFSFSHDGPLDMRMGNYGENAAYFINNAAQDEIADVIYNLGGERKSRAIAKAIVEARSVKPITRTTDLAEIIIKSVGRYKDTIHPATRTFQAIRIWVNDELKQLRMALEAAESMLRPGGRLVVVTFHSLEDAIVKNFFNERSGKDSGASRHLPVKKKVRESTFSIINRKPKIPSEKEVANNPRARSAKLRAAIKLGTYD